MNMNALIMAAPPSLMTLPCCHSFHDACVTAWLGKAANCPMCRFCISDKFENYGMILQQFLIFLLCSDDNVKLRKISSPGQSCQQTIHSGKR